MRSERADAQWARGAALRVRVNLRRKVGQAMALASRARLLTRAGGGCARALHAAPSSTRPMQTPR